MKKKNKKLPKGTNIVVDMPENNIRKGGNDYELRKGFPKRDETLDDGNLRRNYYIGLPPDAGFTYGDAYCESCDFSYTTHRAERPFCPKCGNVVRINIADLTLESISDLIKDKSAKTCSECNSNQFTISFCSQCGSQMKGTDSMNKNKKKRKIEAVDVDLTSINDDIEFQVEDDEDEGAEGGKAYSFDEEVNDGDKENAPDKAPLDEQLNEDNDSDGQELLDVNAEDVEDDDAEGEDDVEDDDAEAMLPGVHYNVKKKKAKSEDSETEDDDAEGEDDVEDDDAEGCNKMVVEPIANVDELEEGGIGEDEVDAHLYGEDTENPHWNVTVKGYPVAAIYLSDQEKPFEVARFFTTSNYVDGLKEAISKNGLNNILPTVHARIFSNAFGTSDLAKKMKKAAIASMKKQYQKQALAMADRLLDAVRISVAGANKNIWEDNSNSLKDAMFEQMAKAGIHNPIPYIEKAFEKGADKFFENTLVHAQEIMAKPNAAISELRKVVAGANYKAPVISDGDEIEDEDESPDDINERLVEGNFNVETAAFSGIHFENKETPKLHLGNKLLADMDSM